jgi:hypothetical protein
VRREDNEGEDVKGRARGEEGVEERGDERMVNRADGSNERRRF